MNKRKFPITNIGSVSLLMIFIILCMFTFAALSLSTAASDYHSAQTLADHTTAYYEASDKAEQKLADVDRILKDCYLSSESADSYYQLVKKQLGITDTATPLIYSYQTNINKSQKLTVQIRITYPEAADTSDLGSGFYQIVSWKTVSSTDWNADNSIKLIQ